MIIDTAVPLTHFAATLQRYKVTTVWRYFDPIGPESPKNITPAEARFLAGLGIRLGVVSEGWGDFAHGGISAAAGERDGEYARRNLPLVGAPADAVIAFAVDVDASEAQIKKLVIPYFSTIRRILNDTKYRIMAYGSGSVCSQLTGLADLTWVSCSSGWSGTREYLATNRWTMRQYPPTHIGGIDVDTNETNTTVTVPIDFLPSGI